MQSFRMVILTTRNNGWYSQIPRRRFPCLPSRTFGPFHDDAVLAEIIAPLIRAEQLPERPIRGRDLPDANMNVTKHTNREKP